MVYKAGTLSNCQSQDKPMALEGFILLIICLISYLIGSVASAVLVCKLFGVPDPRTHGSKNPGATNVLRLGGKRPALFTLVADMLKGFLPVGAVAWGWGQPIFICAAMAGTFLGHLYPIFFKFKGGKGVATFLGGLLGAHWILGGAFVGIWLLMAALFKISSLSALVASVCMPVISYWVFPQAGVVTATMSVLVVFIWWRHRENIHNLLTGKEEKLNKRGD